MIPVQRPWLGTDELEAVGRVFETGWLGMGSVTRDFEDALKAYLGAKHVISVNTGTSALHLALDALGLDSGAEVIVPSLTFVASIQAILAVGARPVFCDVDLRTLNMDVDDARSRVTDRTRVVMPVHYGGNPCDIAHIRPWAQNRGIWIVEDAAHAIGSSIDGRKVGTLGDLTCFSFDPIKNITCGEGGAVATDHDALAARMVPKRILGIDNDTWSRYRNERNWFYEVVTPGYRYHLPNINAAIGLAQLKRIEVFRERKLEIVRRYDEAFAGEEWLSRIEHPETSFPFFYVVRVMGGRRDRLMQFLKEREIGAGVHYIPNHLQPLFARFHVSLPVTERLFEEIVTLPLFYGMSDAELQRVIDAVLAFDEVAAIGQPLGVAVSL